MILAQGGNLPRLLRKWKWRSMGYNQVSDADNLGCYPQMKRRRNCKKGASPVTFVVGKEMETFKVDPHILECGLFEPLLDKAMAEGLPSCGKEWCVFLNCDAILFDHMLWLVQNHDPSLRYLNLEALLEFYAQEEDSATAQQRNLKPEELLTCQPQISEKL